MGAFRRSFGTLLVVVLVGAVVASWAIVRIPSGRDASSSPGPAPTTTGPHGPAPGDHTRLHLHAPTYASGASGTPGTASRSGSRPGGGASGPSSTTTSQPATTTSPLTTEPAALAAAPNGPAGAGGTWTWSPRTLDSASAGAIAGEVSFIESAQLPDGAITTYPGSGTVDPYMGSYAADGLAQAAAATGSASDAAAAWRWLDWYANAEGPGGITTDATVVGGSTVPTGTLDATDASAGMFLVAADAAYAATHDTAALVAIEPGIRGAVGAITSLQGADGLTWATATYHAVYLMDEAESYGGLVAASKLAAAAGDTVTAAQASAAASAMAAGVAGLWDPSTGSYDWAVAGDGVRTPTDWSVAYPDAMEQVWAVAFGLVPAARAATLMATVVQNVPAWSSPGSIAILRTNATLAPAPIGYWPVTAWALQAIGQAPAAASGAAAIRDYAAGAGDAWPYTPAIAGQLIVAAAGGVAVP